MITYYATTPHRYTFGSFARDWAPELADRIRVIGYSELDPGETPAPGVHILTDFERLLAPERLLVRRLHRRLSRRDDVTVIGDPGRWMARYPLLRRLHEEGINNFRAYKIDELGAQVRFPVFLRWANEHGGTLGDQVRDREELDRRLAQIAHDHHRRWRWIRDQLLIIEVVDSVSPDGLYRKYSISRIGEDYVPRHILVESHWVTKNPKIVTPDSVAAEEEFLADPPDLDLMKRAFEIAGIEFGRIDWGYAGGRPQIWEINTNPMFVTGTKPSPLRRELLTRQAARCWQALEKLDDPGAAGSPAPLLRGPERWAWRLVNRGSRRWDPKRR